MTGLDRRGDAPERGVPDVRNNDARVAVRRSEEIVGAGRRRAERVARRRPSGRALLGALALVAAVVAWVVLVVVAIDLGRSARADGGVTRWLLTVVASVGAALCLTLVFVLLARARDSLRGGGRHR